MANYERGAYEPRVGDSIPLFDGGIDEEGAEEGSRLPLLIVIALLVLAAFAGVVWLAYTQGVQRGRADAPRVIAAEPGPEREAPAEPGGTATPYTGLKIYQQPAPTDDGDTDTAPAPPSPAVTGAVAPSAVANAPPPDLRSSANAPAETAQPTKASAVQPSVRPATPPPRRLASVVASSPAGVATRPPAKLSSASPPAPAKVVSAPAVAPETPSSTATVEQPPPAPAAGAYVLQIGAYKSQDEADASWHAFQSQHSIAAGYTSRVKKVDLGDKGVWYRLQLASFADKGAAATFCEKLKADGGSCFVGK